MVVGRHGGRVSVNHLGRSSHLMHLHENRLLWAEPTIRNMSKTTGDGAEERLAGFPAGPSCVLVEGGPLLVSNTYCFSFSRYIPRQGSPCLAASHPLAPLWRRSVNFCGIFCRRLPGGQPGITHCPPAVVWRAPIITWLIGCLHPSHWIVLSA